MKLSAIILVRNSEKTITQCLSSIKDLCSEIICVVDTRSNDSSVKKIGEFALMTGANVRVLEYEWLKTDYSAARNFGVDKVTNEWYLRIDSDESLSKENCDKVRKLLSNPAKDVYGCIQMDKNGQMCHIFCLMRKHARYIGDIHETIDLNCLTYEYTDIVINHNKNLTNEEHEAKTAFILETISGISEEVKKDYYEGIYYLHTGEHRKGLDALNRCINNVSVNLKAFIYLVVARHYMRISQMYELEGLHFLNKCIDTAPKQNEGYVLLSDYYRSKNDKDNAVKCLSGLAGLTTQLQNDKYYTQEQITSKINQIKGV